MVYIYNLDPYIDLGMLEEKEEFFLLNHIEENFFTLEEGLILEDSLKYTFDYFCSLTVDYLKAYNSLIKDNDLKPYIFISLNKDILVFFYDLFKSDNCFFNSDYKFFSHNFLQNTYSNYFFIKQLGEISLLVYNLNLQKKYKFLNDLTLDDYIKSLYFNGSNIRTFFLERILSLKNRGNLKKFNSYFFFLDKYMYYNYFGIFENKKFNFFIKLINFQNSFSVESEFSGNSFLKSFFFPNYTNFEFMKNYYSSFYLNLQKTEGNIISIGNESIRDKNSYDFFYFNSKSSSGFLKYSTDFFLKHYDLSDIKFKELYLLKDEKSEFNSTNLFLEVLFHIKKISKILKNIK
jgi:hypothetical protein